MSTLPYRRVCFTRSRQSGAALVVGLILLMVLTLLAISGMGTATMELQMAGNQQFAQNAFQAAESGIDNVMVSDIPEPLAPPEVRPPMSVSGSSDTFTTRIESNCDNGITAVPAGGFSLGAGGMLAYHFDITSTGTAGRSATSTNTQSFYIVGPTTSC